MKITTFFVGITVLSFLANTACAQNDAALATNSDDFSLFESLDNTASNAASSVPGRNNARERGARNTQSSPTFVLVGTSTIGNQRSALLKHQNGDVVRVPLTDTTNPIPNHSLYSVVAHGAGQVSIRFPAAVLCDDFPEQGVSCNSDANIASLSLTTAKAIVNAQEAPTAENSEAEEVAGEPASNPFEAIRERGRTGSNQAAQSSRFQPRRIDPSDVPPGMRVVSTPFGDRLVQQ